MQALDPLNNLVAWVIMRIHAVLGAIFGPASGVAWGLSIVILVMFIRLLLVPLFVKQVHAQRKMAQHAPQLQELRKKYKGDKQRLNEETMKFYKENGVNPLAGCLPMIPQMIVFFALFNVLRAITSWTHGTVPKYGLTVPVVVSAQKATIFGVHLGDKLLFSHQSLPLHVAIVIVLTVVVSATHDVHDRPAERQAWSHADQRGPGQPDGPVAEVHAVHRPVLLADRVVLGVRPGALLGDDQPVDAWPAVVHVQELDHRARRGGGRSGRRGYGRPGAGHAEFAASWLAASGFAASGVFRFFGIRCRKAGAAKAGAAKAAGGGARTDGPRTGSAAGDAQAATASGRAAPAGSGSSGSARAKGGTASSSGRTGNGSGGARTGTAARPAAPASRPATAQNGTEKRGLLRLGRPKPEPEPQDDVPAIKVERVQPVRQPKSKRSGKR